MKNLILTTAIFASAILAFGQGYMTVTGSTTDTNVLTSIPLSGTLLIDYDFYTIPDTMDVYYNGVDIFSSGYVAYSGQFIIPYGPGPDTSLTIVMDQASESPGTLWSYTPTVVPEPSSFAFLSLGFATFIIWLKTRGNKGCNSDAV